MSNMVHVSDLVQAQEMIQVLSQKNAELVTAKEKWELTFESAVESTTDGSFELVITARVGGTGVIHRVGAVEVLQFAGNYETLSDWLAIELMTKLFEQRAKEELRPAFIRGARNIEALVKKTGGLR